MTFDQKDCVRQFYDNIWNERRVDCIPDLLTEDFQFRGSLGFQCNGLKGFEEYVNSVHGSLSNYHCEIVDMLAEDRKVFAKMLFSGLHVGSLLGRAATNRQVSWWASALFEFKANKIQKLWGLDSTSIGCTSKLFQRLEIFYKASSWLSNFWDKIWGKY